MLVTTVCSEDAQVVRAEVMNLLEKGAIEIVHPAQTESGFYSRYFLVPKKDGGLRPILDLRLLNYALMKRSFRMITFETDPSENMPRGLLALASVKRVGDLQALSANPACLEFGPNDSKVVLKPRLGYVPKVLSTPFRAQVIALSVLRPPPTSSQESLRCPVRALKVYIEHSATYIKSEQLFVGFGNRAKGGADTKQRISRWLVDAITLAYSSLGLQFPIGVRAHSTRGIASSWAWSSGVSISDIFEMAGWFSPSTFVRFYSLDVPALQARVLSA